MSNHLIIAVLCVSSVISNINIRRTGWLDRVVIYYKNKFYDDLRRAPLIKIKARIERPPSGYTDSKEWDYKSVIRLLTLIRQSEDAVEVRRAITRTMKGNRRFMSVAESLKAFPSLAKNHPNEIYYSVDSGEYYADAPNKNTKLLEDDDVIIVTNPVEARLPSARISVQLLKSILENRAIAGRYMTSTVKIFSWLPISSSKDNVTQGLSNASVSEGGITAGITAGVTGGNTGNLTTSETLGTT